MKQYYLILGIIAVFSIALISGCVQQEESPTESEFVIARLINVVGGDFVESAGYYEGMLTLKDVDSNEEYSIFACAEDWSWVEENSCYKFSPSEVEENVESHKMSAQLSGCYVGTLEKADCE